MARGGGVGKLTKLKSVLKKWHSFGKPTCRSNSGSAINAAPNSYEEEDDRHCHPVYVGKSRRRYLISSEVAEHPLFQELVERSGDGDSIVTVDCEVVLFEHLLWMLENADPQPESLEELVEFYAC